MIRGPARAVLALSLTTLVGCTTSWPPDTARPLPTVRLDADRCPELAPWRTVDLSALLPHPQPGYPVRMTVLSHDRLVALQQGVTSRHPGSLASIDATGHLSSVLTIAMPCVIYRNALAGSPADAEVARERAAFARAMALANLDVLGVKQFDERQLLTRLRLEHGVPVLQVIFPLFAMHELLEPWVARALPDEVLWKKVPAETDIVDETCASGQDHAGGNGCFDRLGGKVHVPVPSVARLERKLDVFSFPDRLEGHLDAWLEFDQQAMPHLDAQHPQYTVANAGPHLVDLVTGANASHLRGDAPLIESADW